MTNAKPGSVNLDTKKVAELCGNMESKAIMKKTGIRSSETVTRIITGLAVNQVTLDQFAEAFGVSPESLIAEQDPQEATPSRISPEDMSARRVDLAEEFLMLKWPTYGLATLRNEHLRNESFELLDRITSVLVMSQSQTSLLFAEEMLADWLSKKEAKDNPAYDRLKLRHIMAVRQQKDFPRALKLAKEFIQRHPNMPAMQCFVGNLFTKMHDRKGWEESIEYFDRAIELDKDWWEPRLEKYDIQSFLGVENKDYWRAIARSTADVLSARRIIMAPRERLIVILFHLCIEVLLDTSFLESDHFARYYLEASKDIKLSEGQREDWDFRHFYKDVLYPALSSENPRKQDALAKLTVLLQESHKQLHSRDWNER